MDAATFGVRDWTLTGVPNPIDITGGKRTVVYASKMPDHRGIVLNGDVEIDSSKESLVITRSAPGLEMKIQAKDCANGGVFQMEVEREGGTRLCSHTFSVTAFSSSTIRRCATASARIFRAPAFCRMGHSWFVTAPTPDGTVTVTARTNFANDFSNKFVGRDSPQVATRITNGCPNSIPHPTHPGSVDHCGGISLWSVASGGRMGQVMGEDAAEIAPAATVCTENCIAQNQVNGRAVVVGFPFPVPTEVRLQPRFPQLSNGQLARSRSGLSTVNGGATAQGTVSLDAGAPAGGVVVQLTSSNPNVANVPATATIPEGFAEITFNITTTQVMSLAVATLQGASGGVTRSVGFTVTPQATSVPDSVTITKAEYQAGSKKLKVEATSTVTTATLQVFVASSNQLIGTLSKKGGGKFGGEFTQSVNPQSITVRSSSGGSATLAVKVK